MAGGQYAKLYHLFKDEYPEVWRSDPQLALFIRLLVAADKWYPQFAPIGPRNGAYQSLLKAGLVIENEGGDGYTIRGLEAERERRSHAARNAAASRWGMPSKAEQSKAEQTNGHAPASTFMGWKPRIDRADIDRQQDESLADAIAKAKAREVNA